MQYIAMRPVGRYGWTRKSLPLRKLLHYRIIWQNDLDQHSMKQRGSHNAAAQQSIARMRCRWSVLQNSSVNQSVGLPPALPAAHPPSPSS